MAEEMDIVSGGEKKWILGKIRVVCPRKEEERQDRNRTVPEGDRLGNRPRAE
jgi:hypothetical protein